MKAKFIIPFLFTICSLFFISAHGQNVTIDYQAWNPASPPCNLFSSPTNVPATIDGSAGTIQHQTKIGQPEYSTSDKSVMLECNYNGGNPTEGTRYRLSYNFKKGYLYTITINAAEEIGVSAPYQPWLSLEITNN